MQNSRFVILTGHLNDYPLADLVGILRHQRKSGRLLIEYEQGPGVFFFHEGELVDARVNDLIGLQAVCFAVAQPNASFNFNPLIQPSEQTIEDSLQRTVSELFGCWDESPIEIDAGVIDVPLLQQTTPEPVLEEAPRTLPGYETERLALPPAVVSSSRRPASVLLMTFAGFVTLCVSTAIALSGSFRTDRSNSNPPATAVDRSNKSQPVNETTAAASLKSTTSKNAVENPSRSRTRSNYESQSERQAKKEDNSGGLNNENSKPATETSTTQKSQPAESVTVVMEIENGRVLRASIANPKPGMDSYEALALRIARQRRYSTQQNGRETVKIKVSPSDQ